VNVHGCPQREPPGHAWQTDQFCRLAVSENGVSHLAPASGTEDNFARMQMRVLTAAGRPENTDVVVHLPDKSDEDGDEQTCIHGQLRSRSRRVRRPTV